MSCSECWSFKGEDCQDSKEGVSMSAFGNVRNRPGHVLKVLRGSCLNPRSGCVEISWRWPLTSKLLRLFLGIPKA